MSRIPEDASKSKKSSVFTEDNSKLEWMYKSGSELLNREEYLLGKTIDKQFEKLDEEEKTQKSVPGITVPKNHVEHECIPFSIRSYRSIQTDEQVDIQRKIMEDPLMLIRQKEMESRRRILENPVKLKELHRLLKKEEEVVKSSKGSKKKSKKGKDKKHSKKKKKHKDSSDSATSSDDEDLDKLLARKYRQIKEEFGANDGTFNLKRLLGKEAGKSSDDEEKLAKCKKKMPSDSSDDETLGKADRRSRKDTYSRDERRPYEKEEHTQGRYDSRKDKNRLLSRKEDTFREERGRGSIHEVREKQQTYYSKADAKNKEDRRKYDDSRDRLASGRNEKQIAKKQDSPKISRKRKSSSSDDSSLHQRKDDNRIQRKNYGLVTASGDKIELKQKGFRSESSHRSRKTDERSKPPEQAKVHRKERLTDEEKERRLREMMNNAEWRDEERKRNMEKHRKDSEREKDEAKSFDRNFISKEMHKAMKTQTSVESRLKSNINNIQRSGKAMESNFARR